MIDKVELESSFNERTQTLSGVAELIREARAQIVVAEAMNLVVGSVKTRVKAGAYRIYLHNLLERGTVLGLHPLVRETREVVSDQITLIRRSK